MDFEADPPLDSIDDIIEEPAKEQLYVALLRALRLIACAKMTLYIEVLSDGQIVYRIEIKHYYNIIYAFFTSVLSRAGFVSTPQAVAAVGTTIYFT